MFRTYWLLEVNWSKPARYEHRDGGGVTDDPWLAMRFNTQEEAIVALADESYPPDYLTPVEHGFEDDNDSLCLLDAVKCAYRKHHLGDDSIGWGELSSTLLNALCNYLGDEGFQEWLRKVRCMKIKEADRDLPRL